MLLGPVVEGASAAGVSARALKNGDEAAATADATEATGDPVDLVLHVANVVGAAGEALRAGEVVICGSVVPALDVAPGDTVEVQLDPLGSLTRLVRLSGACRRPRSKRGMSRTCPFPDNGSARSPRRRRPPPIPRRRSRR